MYLLILHKLIFDFFPLILLFLDFFPLYYYFFYYIFSFLFPHPISYEQVQLSTHSSSRGLSVQPSIIPLIYLSTHSSAGKAGRSTHNLPIHPPVVIEPGMNSTGVNAAIISTPEGGGRIPSLPNGFLPINLNLFPLIFGGYYCEKNL